MEVLVSIRPRVTGMSNLLVHLKDAVRVIHGNVPVSGPGSRW